MQRRAALPKAQFCFDRSRDTSIMGNSSAKPSPEIEEAERQLGSQAAAVRRDFEQLAQGQQATTAEQMADFLEIDAAFAKALFDTDAKGKLLCLLSLHDHSLRFFAASHT